MILGKQPAHRVTRWLRQKKKLAHSTLQCVELTRIISPLRVSEVYIVIQILRAPKSVSGPHLNP